LTLAIDSGRIQVVSSLQSVKAFCDRLDATDSGNPLTIPAIPTPMSDSVQDEVLKVSQALLSAIDRQDWTAYADLCDPTLTCFEPEAAGHLVSGMPFHEFYFQPEHFPPAVKQSSLSSPHVRIVGDCAVVSYVRLTQKIDAAGQDSVTATNETRVWQKQGGRWKHVHFHRSRG
jgi:ketosteroid isomerase-like protein